MYEQGGFGQRQTWLQIVASDRNTHLYGHEYHPAIE
ncbi:hypothetical protein ANO14919_143020 [Xylariales sp. No.14919]|nr:hypothetical protein ANO14919_143020 [Xylariales sp. No.14919]